MSHSGPDLESIVFPKTRALTGSGFLIHFWNKEALKPAYKPVDGSCIIGKEFRSQVINKQEALNVQKY